jgi:hypothetical protein
MSANSDKFFDHDDIFNVKNGVNNQNSPKRSMTNYGIKKKMMRSVTVDVSKKSTFKAMDLLDDMSPTSSPK